MPGSGVPSFGRPDLRELWSHAAYLALRTELETIGRGEPAPTVEGYASSDPSAR